MSFCCGAGMIGAKGTLKHIRTRLHHVPILFCPVCHRIKIHHLARMEYEILAEYAHGDGATDIDFEDYASTPDPEVLFANCISNEVTEAPLTVVRKQIDMALDLLVMADRLQDAEWMSQLKTRLHALGKRQAKLQTRLTERDR